MVWHVQIMHEPFCLPGFLLLFDERLLLLFGDEFDGSDNNSELDFGVQEAFLNGLSRDGG